MTKQQLVQSIKKIAKMNTQEVISFQKSLSLSKVDAKAKTFLYRACETRHEELNSRASAMCVSSDFD